MSTTSKILISAMMLATAAFAAEDKAASEAEKKKTESLARVVIVQYEDLTKTKNFGYMPDSLTEAIDKSLQLKFEYLREDPEKTEAAVASFQKLKGRLGQVNIVEFCKINKSEIVILGSFVFDKEAKELVVTTFISLCRADGFRTLPERRNPVDASIFKLADKVADDIVRELTQIAKEQAPEKQAEKRKGEKIELKKEKPTAWSEVNWSISPSLNIAFPLNSSFSGRREPQPVIQLMAEYRLKGPWHVGLFGGFTNIHAGYVTLDLFTGGATLGYNIDLSNRWRLGLTAGGGYYFGKFYENNSCAQATGSSSATGTCSSSFNVRNPYATARVSLKFLIFQWLSVGIFGQQDTFFDGGGNKPLFFAGGGLVIGAHF